MTTITQTYREIEITPVVSGEPLDSLDLRDAVIGDGVMLTRSRSHGYVIHTLGAGRAELVGSFDTPAAAMNALDALELDC